MAITMLDNYASVTFEGASIISNTVNTLLKLPPTIIKAVDLATALIGDILTYTITITNTGVPTIPSLPFRDSLPVGCAYLPSSFTVNGTTQTPTLTGNVLTYTISSIPSLAVAVIVFQATVLG